MPYRIDIFDAKSDAFDKLVELGALDIEILGQGIAAVLPDAVSPDSIARALNAGNISVSAAVPRDNDSVWLLAQRPIRIGGLQIVPNGLGAPPGALTMSDSGAFGTGYHPTTALCIEAMEELLAVEQVASILDVGTGSGILALAALNFGVLQATGIDTDPEALRVAAENASRNALSNRLRLVHGGPDAVIGVWPMVVANILAAPLIEMAPMLVKRVAHRGHLILCGVALSVEAQVRRAYEHLGMRLTGSKEREGWLMIMMRASW